MRLPMVAGERDRVLPPRRLVVVVRGAPEEGTDEVDGGRFELIAMGMTSSFFSSSKKPLFFECSDGKFISPGSLLGIVHPQGEFVFKNFRSGRWRCSCSQLFVPSFTWILPDRTTN